MQRSEERLKKINLNTIENFRRPSLDDKGMKRRQNHKSYEGVVPKYQHTFLYQQNLYKAKEFQGKILATSSIMSPKSLE